MKAILNITKQVWTGWNREQPKPEEQKVEAEKGTKLDFVSGFGNPRAMVEDVLEDGIVIATNALAPRTEGGGINLRADYSNLKAKLKIGESVKLTTQTMDGGLSFTFSLLEIIQ